MSNPFQEVLRGLQASGLSGRSVLGPLTRRDSPRSAIPPTSSKKVDESHGPVEEFQELNSLAERFQRIRTDHLTAVGDVYNSEHEKAKSIEDEQVLAQMKSLETQVVDDFALVSKRSKEVLDPTKPTTYSYADIRAKFESQDLGSYSDTLMSYLSMCEKEIGEPAKKLKTKAQENGYQTRIDRQPKLNPTSQSLPYQDDKNRKIPERTLQRWVYDFEIFYIRPDNVTVNVDSFITEMVYTIDYDAFVMPIFTFSMLISDEVLSDLKDHFERLRFFMNVQKWSRDDAQTDNGYARKTSVFEHLELVPLDPQIPVNVVADQNDLNGLPRHRIVLDLVGKKNADLNGKVKSKIFSNVRVLDVIMALLDEAVKDQKSAQVADKDIVKYTVAPPDNTRVYEQIILDPGTISQNLRQLQEQYGVYQTGIRVSFDTVSTEKDPSTGRVIHKSQIVVSDKGGNAPSPASFDQVLIEIIDPNSKSTRPETDSGSKVDEASKVLIVRTNMGYQIDKNNSSRYLDGQSVRVIGSSQNDTILNECDIGNDSQAAQRTYWGNNDNPYNLTQLQDSIREKALAITVGIADSDVFAFNQNLKFILKFYNRDSEAHDGEYRLKAAIFRFVSGKPTEKIGVPLTGYLRFSTIPDLRVNGALVPRESYVDRLTRLRREFSQATGKVISSVMPAKMPSFISGKPAPAAGPWSVASPGRNDYNGTALPRQVERTYKMSRHITMEDIYVTKDGAFPDRAQALCQDFDLFCYAQRFSNLVLDPIIDKYGKFPGGGGRMNSFYRYHTPSGGSPTSVHKVALGADMLPTMPGDALCTAFFWIARQSNIPYDQIILEGNGQQWRWIHVGLNMNGANRKQIKLSPTGQATQIISVNPGRLTSPSQLEWAHYRNELS
jgi:hypothetical protein